MSRLKFSEHIAENGGAWNPASYAGGRITEINNLLVPTLGEDTDDPGRKCYTALINQLYSISEVLANTFQGQIYRDGADANTEFRVSPFSVFYRGVRCVYAGGAAVAGLVAGATRYIYAVLDPTGPSVTITVATAWPAVTMPGVIRLGTIAQPGAGPWKPANLTRYAHEQAIVVPGGFDEDAELDFSTATANGTTIVTVPANRRIKNVSVIITTPFNGAPVITIGDAGNNARLFAAASMNPAIAAPYEVRPLYKYAASTDIKVYIALGGATVGDGTIIID